ncbi:Translin [Hondaea fermentalgiana]|uniref:Translin n=1 Tax=Hondaea fermentalgiana TaxID=2315210 RepID=A0A2R5GN96_9STRA|nr:Translin [Hondaea fermentalgiana]|eukprot:GBG30093.1 Translin [Hondaea fermentalgiana]
MQQDRGQEGDSGMPAAKRAKTETETETEAETTAAKKMTPPVPARPSPVMLADAASESNLAAFATSMQTIRASLVAQGEARDRARVPCRELRSLVESGLRKAHEGKIDSPSSTMDQDEGESASSKHKVLVKDLLEVCSPSVRNQGHVSMCLSAYVAFECFCHFVNTGVLLQRRTFPELTSTEYLMGTLRFADELETYAIGRGMSRDIVSVSVCSQMVKAMNAAFIQFNLRNGPLRRRYDSLKYRVRKMEDILYELSLICSDAEVASIREHEQLTSETLLDMEEFGTMVKEIDEHTEEREKVITTSRGPQKDSKKAIYALHRENWGEARKLLTACEETFNTFVATTKIPRDELHAGSFGNALEEYAEARIFEEWRVHKGSLLTLDAMREQVDIQERDYLGGIVDFTGEIGRYGVVRATARDEDTVKQVLATMLIIKDYAIDFQEIADPKMVKKLEAVFNNERKMRNTLYELTLLKHSKRKTLDLDSTRNMEPSTSAED